MKRIALAILLLLALPVAAQMSTGGGPKESPWIYVVTSGGKVSGGFPVIIGTGIGPDPTPNKTIGYQFNEYPGGGD